MSDVRQIGGADLDVLWILLALPLGLGLDLALGDFPGRGLAVRWMGRLIATVEDGVTGTVARLGGGRGGALFGGLLLTSLVAGTAAGVAWLVVDLADATRGPITLAVRALVIAAGLAVRTTGDRILHAAEADDRGVARDWLASLGGRAPARLDELGVASTCLSTVGELTAAAIVAPLFWLAVGGPAGMWGFLALRSLRETMQARGDRADLGARVTVGLADVAEALPAWSTWPLLSLAGGLLGGDARAAWRAGWAACRRRPTQVVGPPQGAVAGALGVRIAAGRVFVAASPDENAWAGVPGHPPESSDVVRAVRMMQITALMAAMGALTASIWW